MENKLVIKKYRDIRAFIKVLPFLYVLVYLLGMIIYIFGSLGLIGLVDLLFSMSPFTMLINLLLGRYCDLCKWHRLACVTPIVGFISVVVDSYIYSVGHYGFLIIIINFTLIFTLSILSAYFMFIRK